MTEPSQTGVFLGRIAQVVVPARELEASKHFYSEQFGLEHQFDAPNVVALQSDGVRILLTHQPDFEAASSGVILYLAVSDIERAHKALVDQGAPDRGPPHLIATLERLEVHIAFVGDPSGNTVGLIQERAILAPP